MSELSGPGKTACSLAAVGRNGDDIPNVAVSRVDNVKRRKSENSLVWEMNGVCIPLANGASEKAEQGPRNMVLKPRR